MESRQWINRSQPQTLQVATMLLYINAVFGIISGFANPLAALIAIVEFVAGIAIANEFKWGYWLGVVSAFLPLILIVMTAYQFGLSTIIGSSGVISLMFIIALIALLLHPHSRSYKKIWFR